MGIYEGQEKYIFVSYAHKDKDVVLPIVDAMIAGGFRVWYDQGIEAGTEWPAYIEDHLLACERVLVFISPYSVESINCRNEINLAATENKEMLVVYLEDTKLMHGLNLQLGAKQSLFRSRHTNDRSFVEELLKAKILECCREGYTPEGDVAQVKLPPMQKRVTESVPVTNDYVATVSARRSGPSAISRVGAIPSNNPENPWPGGTYMQSINTSSYSTVHFHCNLLHTATKAMTCTVGIRIFNEKDALVYESTTPLAFKPGDQRFSLRWVVKDASGLAQAPGVYTALIWIDDSKAYEFPIRLTSSTPSPEVDSSMTYDVVKKEIEEIEKKLAFPKIALLQLLNWGCFILTMSWMANENIVLGFAAMMTALVLSVNICKELKKVGLKSLLLRLVLVYLIGFYFGIYLVVMGGINLINKKALKDRLAALKSTL